MTNENRNSYKRVFSGGCPAKAREDVNVSVPVEITADADIGDVCVRCAGPCSITREDFVPEDISRFTISQRLRVDIPLEFTATAKISDADIDFCPATCERCERCDKENCEC